MERDAVMQLLQALADGTCTPEEAYAKLKVEPFEELGYAKVDHHRAIRRGDAEVIFGERKTVEQMTGILQAMERAGTRNILITRLAPEAAEKLAAAFPLRYEPQSRIAVAFEERHEGKGLVVVASGGTSDIPVCEEAAITAETLGSRVERVYDVGVAGIHRLLAQLPTLNQARAIVAVAGMEGALASVVAGLVDCPVIAVPTSVGYGASFGGVAALLAMLNSCASGISVVNIDNGFGAGFLANMINRMEGVTQ